MLRIERRMALHVPWGLLASCLAVAGIGIWNLASASRPPHNPVWMTQSIYCVLGFAFVAAVSLLNYRFLYQMAVPAYVLNIIGLLALRVVGHTAKGAESWFVLGPIRVQPAEFMKIGMILMLAKFYHDDYRQGQEPYGLFELWKPVLISLLPFGLVLVQPDLGTALMLFFTSLTVILFGRVKTWVVVVMAITIVATSVVIWNDFVRESPDRVMVIRQRLKKHQAQRITGWLNPEADLKGTNYHAAQSMIAVGSGRLTGKGWGQGTQTGLSFLPEQHTDFIFSVWAEEHGFLACALLLFLYAVILLSILGVAFDSRDRFGSFVAVGVAAMIFWQVFENIGMVSGLLPVTGITLPLMSYGGSSMVSILFSIGLLVNIAVRRHIF